MTRRIRTLALGAALLAAPAAVAAQPQSGPGGMVGGPPAVRFEIGPGELGPLLYPERYGMDPERVEADSAWVADRAEDLLRFWDAQGPTLLRRVGDVAGFRWPYADVEVQLVRVWPVISTERPLVVALDAIKTGTAEVDIPEDVDLQALILLHQLTHYLLDDPPRAAPGADVVREHPWLDPGGFGAEAMVNWVVYTVLEEAWGRDRFERATRSDLWRSYNPNHDFVRGDLAAEGALTRTRTLRDWLVAHPRGSDALRAVARARDRRAAEADESADAAPARPAGLAGTDYGLDLGSSFDGRVFVAWVDEGSPAHRAGVLQGDVVRTVEGRPIADVGAAQGRMDASWEEDGEIDLSVMRGEREVFLTIDQP